MSPIAYLKKYYKSEVYKQKSLLLISERSTIAYVYLVYLHTINVKYQWCLGYLKDLIKIILRHEFKCMILSILIVCIDHLGLVYGLKFLLHANTKPLLQLNLLLVTDCINRKIDIFNQSNLKNMSKQF